MTSRRRFLQLTATAFAWAGGGRLVRAETRHLLLAQILPATQNTAAAQGALLAAEEAARTAELLGARLELRVGEPQEAAALIDQGALALIGGLDTTTRAALTKLAEARGVPLLTTRAPGDTSPDEPLREHVFHVASSPRDRREALERWKGQESVEIVDWHPSLKRFGAEQLNQRYQERFGTAMEPLAWVSWMAVKAAAETALRGADTPTEFSRRIAALGFDGHKGLRLRFRPNDHHLQQPLYAVSGGRVLAEIAPEEQEL
ncbi:MAG TPA: hypothetical protein VKM72_17270 [Thermoanaerobaculia bacterium]|nr:hypothetical protein [Thermoanaerobaculia bacterium]